MNDESPDPAELRDHLERVLRHPEFVTASRLTAFLRFVVNETIEGRASRVKAYTIATTVFGRGESFDPQTNPVVRVEAMRLRQALTHYYATDGAGDEIEIRIGRGSYVPEFIRRDRAAERPLPLAHVASPPASSAPIPWKPAPWMVASGTALALVLLATAFLTERDPALPPAPVRIAEHRPDTGLPTINVATSAPASDASLSAFAELLGGRLETALARFEYPVVVQRPVATPQYVLTASVRPAGNDHAAVDVKITHSATSTILWAREFEAIATGDKSGGVGAFSGEIASRVAHTYGLVFSDIRKRVGPYTPETRGFDCVVLASAALADGGERARRDAVHCLERTLAGEPEFSVAQSALVFLKLSLYLDGLVPDPAGQTIEAALALAGRAVSLTPNKSRPHSSQFWARFLAGRFEDAFDSARTAIDINPYASDTLARIGAAHMLRGRINEGMDFLKRAGNGGRWRPGWQEFYYFLHAHMNGDDARAARHAFRSTTLNSALGHVARIIATGATRDAARVRAARQDLERQFPAFAADIGAGLARYQMAPEIRQRLLDDLAAAQPLPPPEGVNLR